MPPAKEGEKSMIFDFVFLCAGHCPAGPIEDKEWKMDHDVDIVAIVDTIPHVKRAKIRMAIPDMVGGSVANS